MKGADRRLFRRRFVTVAVIILASICLVIHHSLTRNYDVSVESMKMTMDFHEKPEIVIYNRVPKCGSQTIGFAFKELSKRNGFSNLNVKPYRQYRLLGQNAEKKYVKFLFSQPRPLLYTRHVYYVDIDRHREVLELEERIPYTYINLIRDPLERQISQFYFDRYGYVNQEKLKGEKKKVPEDVDTSLQTFDECIEQGSKECRYTWNQVRFFCGQDPICTNATQDALQLAKHNVLHHYMAVGTLEDIDMFLEVLEMVHPMFFSNLKETYGKIVRSPRGHHATANRKNASEETKALLRRSMGLDYEFYYFVRQHLYNLHASVTKTHALPWG